MAQSGEIDVNAYAKLHFCHCCGYLLDFKETENGVVTCINSQCRSRFSLKDHEDFEYFSKFKELQQIQSDNSVEFAIVNEECPKCKNLQMKFYTLQTRSADEGQTVFYECLKCNFKNKVDN